jgi:DnaJ-class molecular chaperone
VEKEISLPSGRRLAVKIPPGITTGGRLRFAGQGAPGIDGGPPGDAYIEIHVREDKRFKQEGDDLVLELPIALNEAVFGAELRVPTPEGAVMLKIPPKSNTGRKLRLMGKGMVNRQTGRRGNMLVVLNVVLPDEIDPELESALRAWQKRHPYHPRERGAA